MKPLLSLILVFMVLPACASPKQASPPASHYDIRLHLNPRAGEMKVSCHLRYVALEPTDSVAFLLNKDLKVSNFSSGEAQLYRTDSVPQGFPVPLENTNALWVKFPKTLSRGQSANMTLEYGGKIDNARVEMGRGAVLPEWTELTSGTGWYPWNMANPMQTYQVEVYTPDSGFRVEGGGKVTRNTPVYWTVKETNPSLRISVIVSDAFHEKSFSSGGSEIKIFSLNAADPLLNKIAEATGQCIQLFSQRFGAITGTESFKIFYANKKIPVNYVANEAYSSNGNFIVLMSDQPEREQIETIAHEVAHFWWNRGELLTYNEFFSESFAEYAALHFIQKHYGESEYQHRLALLREKAKRIGSVRLYNDDLQNRNKYLYLRGPVALVELEKIMGSRRFDQLLRNTYRQNISRYEDFRKEIERLSNKEAAEKFDRLF